jgi:hypothetical protein
MIELPRAALQAGEIAKAAEFFSFGTNDLTQTVLGMSRDDAGSFLGEYLAKGLIARDPLLASTATASGSLSVWPPQEAAPRVPVSNLVYAANMEAIPRPYGSVTNADWIMFRARLFAFR